MHGIMFLRAVLRPVHSSSVSMQGCVPVHRQKLHTTNNTIILSLLKVTVQQLEGYSPEVIHCEYTQTQIYEMF